MTKYILIVLLFFLLFSVRIVSAAEPPASPGQIFRVTPIILKSPLAPGKSNSYSITIENLLPSPIGIHATIEDFTPDGQDDLIRTGGHQDPLISWSTLQNPDLIMDASEKKTLTLTITPTHSASNGNYYELIFLTPFFDHPVSTTSPVVLSRVGVLVSGIIGTVDYSRIKARVSLPRMEFLKLDDKTLRATIHVQNDAAYEFNAKPSLTFSPLWGPENSLHIQDKHVLPHTTRRFTGIVHQSNRIIYKLHTSVSLGSGEILEKSQWFVLLPIAGIRIITVISLLLFTALLLMIRKRFVKAFKIIVGKS